MKLTDYRESRGLSQDEVARQLGRTSKGHISAAERRKPPAPLRLALQLEAWSRGAVPAEGLVSDDDAALLAAHRRFAAARAAQPAEAAA